MNFLCTLHVETANSFFDAWSGIQIYIKSPDNLRWQSRGCQLKPLLIHLFSNLGAHLGIQGMEKELERRSLGRWSQSFSYFRHRSIVCMKLSPSAMSLSQLHDEKTSNMLLKILRLVKSTIKVETGLSSEHTFQCCLLCNHFLKTKLWRKMCFLSRNGVCVLCNWNINTAFIILFMAKNESNVLTKTQWQAQCCLLLPIKNLWKQCSVIQKWVKSQKL